MRTKYFPILLVILSVFFIFMSVAQAEQDLTDKIRIIPTGFSFDRKTGRTSYDFKLWNISDETLSGPFKVAIEKMDNDDISLKNPDGYDSSGKPYYLYNQSELSPRKMTSKKKWIFQHKCKRITIVEFKEHRLLNLIFQGDCSSLVTVYVSILAPGGSANHAPVANAGPDQTVYRTNQVQLDGSASSDADNDPLTYQWTFSSKPTGSQAAISGPNTVRPTFVPDVAGTYEIRLIVNDGKVASTPDTVTITVNPRLVTVPNVVGLPQAEAQSALSGASLIAGSVTQEHSSTVPVDRVISQNPIAGTSVPEGSAVNFVVSLGPVMVTVPSVMGMAQANAQAAITGAGLTVGTISARNNDTVPAGNVISQNPSAGTSVQEGSSVNLVVSLGSNLRISAISPSAALPGETVTITCSGALPGILQIVFSSQAIDTTVTNPGSVFFRVPFGATSGPLYLKQGLRQSNSVDMIVSDVRVVTPTAEVVAIDESGREVAINLVLVSMRDGYDNEAQAQRLAALVGGQVVGKVPLVAGYQFQLPTTSVAELRSAIAILKNDPAAELVLEDQLAGSFQASSQPAWDPPVPDTLGQRQSNRVEQGADLYREKVHPQDPGKLRPTFVNVAVVENGVDYDAADFEYYATINPNLPNTITLSATNLPGTTVVTQGNTVISSSEMHGTTVTGMIAARLGNGDETTGKNSGLLSALEGNHGGFGIRVKAGQPDPNDQPPYELPKYGRIWAHNVIEAANQLVIKDSPNVINWSFGFLRQGVVNSEGQQVTDRRYICSPEYFEVIRAIFSKAIAKIESDYPRTILVVAAGNHGVQVGAENIIPAGISSPSMIVVGAHGYTNSGNIGDIKRPWFSSGYGDRVDVLAAGEVLGSDGLEIENGISHTYGGTSYAAPLVTATIAAMLSINPNLSPQQVRHLLRSSAIASDDILTRPLDSREVGADVTRLHKAAVLNVSGAIQAALDSVTNNSPPSVPVVTSPADNSTNIAPSNIDFTWSPSTDPDGDSVTYCITIKQDASPEDIPIYMGCDLGSFFPDPIYRTSLDSGKKYWWAVWAMDSKGNWSPASEWWSFSTGDITPPTIPENLTGSAISPTEINLSWGASTDNVGVAGYKIYRDGSSIKTVQATTTTDSPLNPSTQYCYYVTAYDAAQKESDPSNTVCVTTLSLPSPTLQVDGGTLSARMQQGGTFSYAGSNYTPNGTVLRHINLPDGSSTTSPITADENGNISWTFTSTCLDMPGTYTLYAEDGATGAMSNTVDQIIMASPGCAIVTLLIDGGTSSTKPQLGGNFSYTGSNYTPNGSVTRQINLPDGSPATSTITADPSGNISWTFPPTCSDTPGTYTLSAVDVQTGRPSNSVTQIITGSASCGSIPQGVVGEYHYISDQYVGTITFDSNGNYIQDLWGSQWVNPTPHVAVSGAYSVDGAGNFEIFNLPGAPACVAWEGRVSADGGFIASNLRNSTCQLTPILRMMLRKGGSHSIASLVGEYHYVSEEYVGTITFDGGGNYNVDALGPQWVSPTPHVIGSGTYTVDAEGKFQMFNLPGEASCVAWEGRVSADGSFIVSNLRNSTCEVTPTLRMMFKKGGPHSIASLVGEYHYVSDEYVGTITFDGNGNYTQDLWGSEWISPTPRVMVSGTYSVDAAGNFEIYNLPGAPACVAWEGRVSADGGFIVSNLRNSTCELTPLLRMMFKKGGFNGSTLPDAPTAVSAVFQSSNNWNYITWNAVSGATSYRVYWGTSPGVTTGSNMLTPTTTTYYGHTGVQGGYTYYYRVSAVNSNGESPLSAEVSAYVPSPLPSPPTGVYATYDSSNNRNFITWNTVSGATSYRVYWGTSPGVTTGSNMLTPTTTPNYGHTGVQGGYTYYYRVTAVNSNGESPLSAEVSAYVPLALPSAPTGVSAVYQSSNNWNYITWNAVSGATSYRVYWGTSPGVTTGSNMLTPTTTTDYGHSGVVRGYTYYYRVTAVSSNGESPLSGEASAYVPLPLPSAPTGVYATYDSSNNRNFITWNTVSGAIFYRVYWGTSPGVTTGSNMLAPSTATNYGHTGVVPGYTYYYRVTAVNDSGESPLSAEVSAYVPLALPSAPTGVSAVYQSSNNWNYITWNAVSGATSYRVYWGTSPGVTTGSNMLTPTTTTDYGHSGVVRGYTYYYRVTAVNSNGESPLSAEVSAYVP